MSKTKDPKIILGTVKLDRFSRFSDHYRLMLGRHDALAINEHEERRESYSQGLCTGVLMFHKSLVEALESGKVIDKQLLNQMRQEARLGIIEKHINDVHENRLDKLVRNCSG